MTDYFKKLVAEYNSAKSEFLKSIIYDAMLGYVEEYHEGYVYYDMDMYVALYKCSTTPGQRTFALKQMDEIIVDDYIYTDGLIENFKAFVSLKDFLNVDDVVEFDILCMKELNFFKARFDATVSGEKNYVSVGEAKEELKDVAQLIVSTGMFDMGSYQLASRILEI